MHGADLPAHERTCALRTWRWPSASRRSARQRRSPWCVHGCAPRSEKVAAPLSARARRAAEPGAQAAETALHHSARRRPEPLAGSTSRPLDSQKAASSTCCSGPRKPSQSGLVEARRAPVASAVATECSASEATPARCSARRPAAMRLARLCGQVFLPSCRPDCGQPDSMPFAENPVILTKVRLVDLSLISF